MAPAREGRYVLQAAVLLTALWVDRIASERCLVSDFNLCPCFSIDSGDDAIEVDCNSVSIVEVMETIKQSDEMRNRTANLNFHGGPDTVLPADTFLGLSRLNMLTIIFQSGLREIHPGAFNSLSNLTNLDISRNGLQWLSRDTFTGIGSRLNTLNIGVNPLRSLRSDLQPFFETITSRIIMDELDDLVCDCHLAWIPNFISVAKMLEYPRTNVIDSGSTCSDQNGLSITDPAVNFTADACRDICSLGYHNCHPNATCMVIGGTRTLCMCRQGYQGDGFTCRPDITNVPCRPGLVPCDQHAVCALADSTQIPTCMCEPGFTGDGTTCAPLQVCNETCLALRVDLFCVVLSQEIVECTSPRVQQLFNMFSDLASNPTVSGVRTFTEQLTTISSNLTFSGDIIQVGNLLFGSVEVLTQNPSLYEQNSYNNLVMVASDLLDNENIQLWLDLNQTTASDHIVELFAALDDLGRALFLQGPPQMDTSIVSDNIAIVVMRPDCESKNQSITISSSTLDPNSQNGESTLVLPVSVFGDSIDDNCREVGVIAIVYGGAGPDLLSLQEEFIPKSNCTRDSAPKAHGMCEWYPEKPCPELEVNSVIITAVAVRSRDNQTGVDELNTTALTEPIVITLQHKNATHVDPSCAFLNEQEVQMGIGRWLTEGCRVNQNKSDHDTTVCECNHLTSFAILTSPAGPPPPNFALAVVSKVGLSISILCLIITIILLFALRIRESKLHHIHRQLALALCLAQSVFLIGVDRILVPSPDAVCTTIAALLHYLFLSTFAWQLVEGVHLYLFIVRVFYNRKVVYAYYPLAWGVPLIVVAVTLGVRFCDYGSQYTCWITVGNGTNWAFHGPVIVVILVNVVVMVMVLYVIFRTRKKRNDDTFLVCTLLHSSFVLLPILGITWALGFFVIGDNIASTIVEWLFCLFNSIQGVLIFVVHCLMSTDVRKAFLKAIGCHEAAKKQESVRTHIRRSSTVNSFSQFNMALKRTFSFSGRRKSSVGDVTSLQISEGSVFSHVGLGVLGIVAESTNMPLGVTNPAYQMEDIAEEGSSIASSIPGTPVFSTGGETRSNRVTSQTAAAKDQEEQLCSGSNSGTTGESPT